MKVNRMTTAFVSIVLPALAVPTAEAQTMLETPVSDPSKQITVSSERTLVIGVEAGEPVYELYRVNDARVLPDGRVVIANSGSSEIRFFDPNGRFLNAHGSNGTGPGEYRVIDGVHVFADDSITVFDQFNQRISIIDFDGALRNTIPLGSGTGDRPGVGGPLQAVGYTSAGLVVSFGGRPFNPRDSTQVVRETLELATFDAETRSTGSSFFSYEGTENFVWANGRSVSVSGLPFGRRTYLATNGDSVIVADNRSFAFEVVQLSNSSTSEISLQHEPKTVTRGMIDDYRENALESLPETFRATRRQALEATPFPSHVASYDKLLVDDIGRVWLRETPVETETATWFVFNSRNEVRWLNLPTSYDPTQATRNWVLGVMTDDLGVEVVVRFGLSR